ncbi:hypothetical protein A2U01_0039442 [Trifolium medium]|uniref:Uncharacterized protein n=1 Tax=Trifolium medium TaxID=97028 RepID=A0A392Q2H8_9FABA|nr:hypothetical protein [Trifolium medium]
MAEPLYEAEDIHDVEKLQKDVVATNAQQTSPLMEPHVVAEDIRDVEKWQEGNVDTTILMHNMQAP